MQRIYFALAILWPMAALAQSAPDATPAGTNFPPLASYPAPTCTKPGDPPKRPGTTVAMEVERYNALLAKYNKVAHDYVVCINAYIRNADSDMDLIRKKSRDAADEANR